MVQSSSRVLDVTAWWTAVEQEGHHFPSARLGRLKKGTGDDCSALRLHLSSNTDTDTSQKLRIQKHEDFAPFFDQAEISYEIYSREQRYCLA
jgi:hypothetical protein